MNKDERSAASTGADSDPHRSNDLNPTSAPALSLPPQRLGSAMEGRPCQYNGGTCTRRGCAAECHGTSLVAEVEALRQRPGAPVFTCEKHATVGPCSHCAAESQRPGAQAASEPVAWRFRKVQEIAWQYIDQRPEWHAANGYEVEPLYASPAGERPAQADDGVDEAAFLARVERNLAAIPGAQAPSTAAKADDSAGEWPTLREDAMQAMGFQRGVKAGWNLCIKDDHEGYARTQQSSEHVRVLRASRLAAPSTGGAACPGIEGFVSGGHMRKVLDKFPLSTGGAETAAQKYDDVLLPFLSHMRRELHANSSKGDRPGWLSMDANTALLEVYWHAAKLSAAVKNNDGPAIQEHSADVANMAMMVLDVCGGLAWIDSEGMTHG